MKKLLSTVGHYTQLASVFAVCLALVSIAAWIGVKVYAADALPPIVEDAAKDIHNNQKLMQAEEPHVQRYNAAKMDNAVQEGRMRTLCYTFDWTKMQPVKMKDCQVPLD